MGKKILVISPTPSHPQTGGAKARIYSLLSTLREMGHDVFFVHIENNPGSRQQMAACWGEQRYFSVPYKSPLSRFTVMCAALRSALRLETVYGIDDWYNASADEFLKQLFRREQFDVVMVEYVFFSRALACVGKDVLKIIDTHDVFTHRHRRYLENGEKPQWFSTTAQQEAKGLQRADLILAIQDNERAYFEKISGKPAVTLGHIVPVRPSVAQGPNRKRILYLGSRNPINVNALNHFVADIFPLVRAQCEGVQLVLAGNICQIAGEIPATIKLGEVNDVKEAYDACDVVINPMRFGTGLKIKTIEALGFGKPLVTTLVGAEGLESGKDQAFLVAESDEDFAEAIVTALSDERVYSNLSLQALAFARQWNTSILKVLDEVFLSEKRSQHAMSV